MEPLRVETFHKTWQQTLKFSQWHSVNKCKTKTKEEISVLKLTLQQPLSYNVLRHLAYPASWHLLTPPKKKDLTIISDFRTKHPYFLIFRRTQKWRWASSISALQETREIVNKSKSINSNNSIVTDKNNDKQIYSNTSVPHRVIAYAFGKVKTTWVVSSFQSYWGI